MAYQEGATIIGERLAQIKNDPRFAKCYLCYKEQSITHVLTGCK